MVVQNRQIIPWWGAKDHGEPGAVYGGEYFTRSVLVVLRCCIENPSVLHRCFTNVMMVYRDGRCVVSVRVAGVVSGKVG